MISYHVSEKKYAIVSSKHSKSGQPRRGVVKTKFISGLRDHEAKFSILDCITTKPAMSVNEIMESLQFGSPATAFASSSSG